MRKQHSGKEDTGGYCYRLYFDNQGGIQHLTGRHENLNRSESNFNKNEAMPKIKWLALFSQDPILFLFVVVIISILSLLQKIPNIIVCFNRNE